MNEPNRKVQLSRWYHAVGDWGEIRVDLHPSVVDAMREVKTVLSEVAAAIRRAVAKSREQN